MDRAGVAEFQITMIGLKRAEAVNNRSSGRKDILIIALIAIVLVGALIFVLLRIIGHSEEHVDTVRKTKIHYKEALSWRPDSETSESRIRQDFVKNPNRIDADYGDLVLNEKAFKTIARMSRLKSLNLTRATFEDKWLSHLTKLPLRKLGLHGTSITDKAVPYLLEMDKLDSLTIGDTELTDEGLKELSKSKTIKHLEINLGRCITNNGVKEIGNMTQLQQLELPCPKDVTGICLAYLTDLKDLRLLNLETMKLNSTDLANLEGFRKLGILDLANCNLTDEDITEIAKVPYLVFLNINGSNLSDKGLSELNKLAHIKRLSIKDCPNVSAKAVKEFRAAHPSCRVSYSQMNNLSEKLKRDDVKMELKFLENEARNELEKSKRLKKVD